MALKFKREVMKRAVVINANHIHFDETMWIGIIEVLSF